MKVYLSSADLMTRNMDKRIEIAWPVLDSELREQILGYLDVSLSDTAKLRELMPDGSYTPLGAFAKEDADGETVLFESQEFFIKRAQQRRLEAAGLCTDHTRPGRVELTNSGGPSAVRRSNLLFSLPE